MTPITGNQVRALRHRLMLNQDDFAARLGVSVSSVQKWERTGDAEIPIRTWAARRALTHLMQETDR